MSRLLGLFSVIALLCMTSCAQDSSPIVLPPPVVQITQAAPAYEKFINETLLPATGILYMGDNTGDFKSVCTVTAIRHVMDDYLFLTAAHCITDPRNPYYVGNDATGPKVLLPAQPRCANYHEGNDVCLLLVTHSVLRFAVAPMGHDPNIYGEAVLNVANPMGLGKEVLHGYVANPNLQRPVHMFTTDWEHTVVLQLPNTYPGSSGSAVVCETQQAICGVVVGMANNQIFAMPVSRVQQLIEKLKVELSTK